MDESKPLLKSKTFWFNVLSSLGTILGLAGGIVAAPAMPYVVAATGLVNVGLRLISKDPVTLKGN